MLRKSFLVGSRRHETGSKVPREKSAVTPATIGARMTRLIRTLSLRISSDKMLLDRAQGITGRFERFIGDRERVIDIGCGPGHVARILREAKDLEIELVDVRPYSAAAGMKATLADGRRLPYRDGAFETSLLILVLHHCRDPLGMLSEAIRVSRGKMVVIEDVYDNAFEKYITFIGDAVLNKEFFRHPHSNKNLEGWLATFKSSNLMVRHCHEFRSRVWGFPFHHALFVLEKC